MFGFYILKFQNLEFTPWSLGVFVFYINILEFGFYPLKFGIWILHPQILKL